MHQIQKAHDALMRDDVTGEEIAAFEEFFLSTFRELSDLNPATSALSSQ
jgi:hypothetical protein